MNLLACSWGVWSQQQGCWHGKLSIRESWVMKCHFQLGQRGHLQSGLLGTPGTGPQWGHKLPLKTVEVPYHLLHSHIHSRLSLAWGSATNLSLLMTTCSHDLQELRKCSPRVPVIMVDLQAGVHSLPSLSPATAALATERLSRASALCAH